MTTLTKTSYEAITRELENGPAVRQRYCEQAAHTIHEAVTNITDVEAIGQGELTVVAAMMNANLSVRDALLMEALGTPTEEQTTTLATDPHDPGTVLVLYRALDRMFNDPDAHADPWRTTAALSLCARAGNAAETDEPQTHAATAYLQWFQGHDDAAKAEATRALQADDQCTLARIVLGAVLNGLHPAYLNK